MNWLDMVAHLLALGAQTEEGRTFLEEALKAQLPLLPFLRDEEWWTVDWTSDPAEWRERLALAMSRTVADGWDKYGAPSAARTPEGSYLASAETPQGPLTVTAESKREAYRKARREWARRMLIGERL